MRKERTLITVICAISLLAACAKNPFSTRDTEEPYGASGTWETPQSPEVTLRNFLFAYNEMIISNYQSCFSDSFLFSSPEDSIDAVNDGRPDLFADWNKQVEIAVTNIIFSTYSDTDTMNLYLALAPHPDYSDIIEDSTAVLYRKYIISMITGHSDETDSSSAGGLATFHLIQEHLNWWTIYLWEDVPEESGIDDWGDFKAQYRQ